MENQHNRKRNRRSSGGGSGRDSGGRSGRGSNYISGHDSGGSGSSGPNQSTGRSSRRTKPTQSTETPSNVQGPVMGIDRFSTDLDSMILGIFNVNTDVTPKDIKKFLKTIGPFKWFCIFYDHKGQVQGEAEVAYREPSDAERAVAELNDQPLKGELVTVAFKFMTNSQLDIPSEAGSEPETSKGKGKRRKKSSDEEEDDPDSAKATKQPRGIKIG